MDVFNRQTALTNASNDPAFLAEIIQMFFEDSATEIEGLRKAVAERNAEKIRFHAHTLKGMAGNIGGERLHAVCLQVEGAGKEADYPAAATLLPQAEEALIALNNNLAESVRA